MFNKALCLPCLGLLVLAGCNAEPEQPPPELAPKVGVVTLQAQDAVLRSELSGRTSAYRVSEVRPQVSGIVRRRLFEEGAAVRAGQVLYQIEPASYQAAHEQAEAALANAQASLASLRSKSERYAELLKIKAVSQQAYDEAQAAYQQGLAAIKAGQATLKTARVELDRTRIVAPIGGRIGRSGVSEGALVTAGQGDALATVQQLDPIFVDIVQSSQELVRLKRRLAAGGLSPAGARVALKLEDGSAYEHPGVLKFAEVGVDPASGAVTLRAQFPNPDGLLMPGMYVRAEVEQGIERGAILVPQQGVSHNVRGEPTARVVNAANRVEERVLRAEGTSGNRWIVTAGLKPGERLIVDGLQRAIPGQPVEPVAATLSDAAAPAGATPAAAASAAAVKKGG
ncbi:efflux RND transporter periplasmic adaptor subunit [Chitinimonas koreensis]|uniref:efflux RND transporter periplasmic adaptor subunit n=1 Tax=Chitinimonas koreensis TaxID=356302 RepID=UPI0003FD524F|nr:efflux RND transporter periplasmic adaptor subunit [Chitinimonas koreensis]